MTMLLLLTKAAFCVKSLLLASLLVGVVMCASENRIEQLNQQFSSATPRIVNGDRVQPGERPFQIALFRGGRFTCGGSLIGPRFVLTAAHCVEGHSPDTLKVLYGTLHYRNGSSATVDRIWSHPSYDTRGVHDDIALIRLTSDVQLENGQVSAIPINSFHRRISADTRVTVSGWGRTARNQTVSEDLLSANLKIVSFDDCAQRWSSVFKVSKGQICASDEDSSACHGDSGGPLTLNEGTSQFQIGVVSVGSSTCFSNKMPNVYTDVYYYRNWIQNILLMNELFGGNF